MRRRMWLFLAGLGVAQALWLGQAGAVEPAKKPAADDDGGCHGTAIQFVATPSEAAHQAKKEQKLVFVLHVSGHFEDPSLT